VIRIVARGVRSVVGIEAALAGVDVMSSVDAVVAMVAEAGAMELRELSIARSRVGSTRRRLCCRR
jgi:hypothetical protein